MKKLIKQFEYFYLSQPPFIRMAIIVMTAITALLMLLTVFNMFYYGI